MSSQQVTQEVIFYDAATDAQLLHFDAWGVVLVPRAADWIELGFSTSSNGKKVQGRVRRVEWYFGCYQMPNRDQPTPSLICAKVYIDIEEE